MSTVLTSTGVTYPDGTTDVTHTPAPTGVVSNSGTSFVLTTSIPSWAKRITVGIRNLTVSATASPIIQLGTSGGYEVSGYTGSTDLWSTTASVSTMSALGIELANGEATGQRIEGTLTLMLTTGNTWVYTFIGGGSSTLQTSSTGGSKTLSGTLTSLRMTTVAGTATVSSTTYVLYE